MADNNEKSSKPAPVIDTTVAVAVKRSIRPQRILVYINAVARYGSIRKAAESLHVASSALNRRILNLENELGLTLFERLPRGVKLTAAGELYVAYAKRAIADLDLVVSRIELLRGLVRGRVRIAATESVAGNLLPAAIAAFQAQHPGVYFNVTIEGAGRLVDSLMTDTADLILTHNLYNRSEATILATSEQPFCALVVHTHPLASRSSLRLFDCQGYPIVLADETLAGRALIDSALRQASFQFEPVMVSNSIELMKAFSRTSQAICFQFQIGALADADMVAIPLTDDGLARSQLFLAMRRGRALSSAAAAFSEHLAAILQTK